MARFCRRLARMMGVQLQAGLGLAHTHESRDPLTVEVATTVEALQSLECDYERLSRVTGNTFPFALHEWHMAWCRQFLESGAQISTQPMIHAARNAEGLCVAIVPLILTRRTIGPVHVSTLDLIGADPAITEIRTSLIEPSYETLAVQAIRRKIGTRSTPFMGCIPRQSQAQHPRIHPPLLQFAQARRTHLRVERRARAARRQGCAGALLHPACHARRTSRCRRAPKPFRKRRLPPLPARRLRAIGQSGHGAHISVGDSRRYCRAAHRFCDPR
jgi:hypothetical protein